MKQTAPTVCLKHRTSARLLGAVGIGLRSHMESGSTEYQELARKLAHRWLRNVDWGDGKLDVRVAHLGEYVAHAIQLTALST